MGLEETKEAVDQQQPDYRQQQFEALHGLLARELRRREVAAAPAEKPSAPAQQPKSVGRAFVSLALAVAVPRLIAMAVWGSIYDEPHWYDLLSAIVIIGGILDVVAAVKARVNAS